MIVTLPIDPVTNEQLGRLRTNQLLVRIRTRVRYSDAFEPHRDREAGYRPISEGMTPKAGRLWTYVRDDRSSGDASPPAVWLACTPDQLKRL